MSLFQTMLFAPANDERKAKKALNLPVDAVILDLEDACALDEKENARKDIIELLKLPRSTKAYVRVNALTTSFFFEDMKCAISAHVDGIVLPMVETAEDLVITEWLVSTLEKENQIGSVSIDLIPIIETAKGVANISNILARKGRVKRIAFGAGDFTNDTAMNWGKEGNELLYTRSQLVIASRAAEIEPPIDTVYVDLADLEGLEKETKHAKNIGFQGKMLIHPQQINVVQSVFRPDEEEIMNAQRIVAAFEEAEKLGSSSIRVGNQFVDYPIVYKARKTLELVGKLKERGN
ncbi:CoA ester lyase [bacterium LRH843]|nr:CoA ester lyase [bacterium LRH843]